GYVIASDANLTVNGKTVARIGDKVICYKHGETEIIAVEKNNVTAGKKQIARIGDKTKCGATLLGGSRNTFAGDK
ncbi:MAG: PAAR domain-containing protein, partial [Ignavibacteriaceae bacterium]